jgi:uncharacterized membrane protein YebE (DUF533 family)
MTHQGLHKDVFIALAAIAWSDGTLDPEEADAIVRCAVEEGLELDQIAEIETATSTRIELGVIDRTDMTKEDRLFVYAVARWIVEIDGVVKDEEVKALEVLGERLGVPEKPRANAERIVREIAQLPAGDRPSRYDLAKLRVVIRERLAAGKGNSSPPAANS